MQAALLGEITASSFSPFKIIRLTKLDIIPGNCLSELSKQCVQHVGYHPESWSTAKLILEIGCSSLQVLPSSSSCWWLPVMASSPNTRFSQWVMAVPKSPWSSSSPPSRAGHLKCLRTSLRDQHVCGLVHLEGQGKEKKKRHISELEDYGHKDLDGHPPVPRQLPSLPSPPSSLCLSQPGIGNTLESYQG